jgi:hypothetical protein
MYPAKKKVETKTIIAADLILHKSGFEMAVSATLLMLNATPKAARMSKWQCQ